MLKGVLFAKLRTSLRYHQIFVFWQQQGQSFLTHD